MKEITMAMEALVAMTFISIAKMELSPDLLLMMNSPSPLELLPFLWTK